MNKDREFLLKKLADLDKFTEHYIDYIQNREPVIRQQIMSDYLQAPGITEVEVEQNTQGRLVIERFYFLEYMFHMWGHYFDDITFNETKKQRHQLSQQWQMLSISNKDKQLSEKDKENLLKTINSMNESNSRINDYVLNQKREIIKELEKPLV